MLTRLRATAARAALLLALAGALVACDSASSSDASSSSGPSTAATQTTPTTDASPSADPTASASKDPASHALCSAVVNAVRQTKWKLADPVAQTRVIGGVPVAACDVAQPPGRPDLKLSLAYLPAGGSLDGPTLLQELCQAVLKTQPDAAGQSCASQGKATANQEISRAELLTGDKGVLVLSFKTAQQSYLATAAADLAQVGKQLAGDQLLALTIG